MPELLAPAGNPEKLRTAIRYGADAVYLSGKMFGMRSAAGNFETEEIREAVAYAHARGVKVYLAVNVMPHEHEYPNLLNFFSGISDIPLDALIVADLGVMALAQRILPKIPFRRPQDRNTTSWISISNCIFH